MAKDLFDFDVPVDNSSKQKKNDFTEQLKLANSLCIREQFDRAIKIFNDILDIDDQCEEAYVGLLRAHSKDFSVYDGEEIETDIRVIEKVFPDIINEQYLNYIASRNKNKKASPAKEDKKVVEVKPKEEKPSFPIRIKKIIDKGVMACFPWMNEKELLLRVNKELDEMINKYSDKELMTKEPSLYIASTYFDDLTDLKSNKASQEVEYWGADYVNNCEFYPYFAVYYAYMTGKYLKTANTRGLCLMCLPYFYAKEGDASALDLYAYDSFADEFEKARGKKERYKFLIEWLGHSRDAFNDNGSYYKGYYGAKDPIDELKKKL